MFRLHVHSESEESRTESEESSDSEERVSDSYETEFSEYRTDSHIDLLDKPRESKRLRGIDAYERTWEERDAGIVTYKQYVILSVLSICTDLPPPLSPRSYFDRADRSNIRLLYACGYSCSDIGLEYGCSDRTISTYAGNSASITDNIESDDEYLDDELLLRLRREKRITIVSEMRIFLRSEIPRLVQLTVLTNGTGC